MQRIVVGVDFSEGSLEAMSWAIDMARSSGARLQLVSAWEYPWWSFLPPPVNIAPVPPADGIDAALAQQLADLIDAEGLGDIADPPHVGEGSAANVLLDVADDDDLLVVGSRGHNAAAGVLLGSVSSRCTASAQCPVAVVPRDISSKQGGPAVVGVDGSANATAALEWAAAHVDPATRIVVVSTWGVPVVSGGGLTPNGLELALEGDHTRATDAAEAASELLTSAGRQFDVVLEEGEARRILSEQAAAASMLVLGARGHTGITHAMLGSVTTSLVRQPSCVVVVVPEPS